MPAELPPDLARLLHDLRGPLNSLTMHTEVLARSVEGERIAEDSARTVREQLARLSAMLTDAFAVAALELGPVQPVGLGAVVEVARAEAGGPVDVAPGDWPAVTGDAALLTLALGHLLRNAVEAGGDGGRPPLVSAAVEGREVLVRVQDSGPGLRATDPKLLIRPWHSSKPGHRGLGLVTAERVARLHGGALRFSTSPAGAVVMLALPR
jgi:two-component system sensor histidine kinase HydH